MNRTATGELAQPVVTLTRANAVPPSPPPSLGEEFSDIENEITMLETCDHPNVVAYYGSFQKEQVMWICMEFCGAGAGTMTSTSF